jgi:hypothetical protein
MTGIIKFPPEWPRDPPCSTYAVLGLALLVLVGGGSLVATMLMVVSAGGTLL